MQQVTLTPSQVAALNGLPKLGFSDEGSFVVTQSWRDGAPFVKVTVGTDPHEFETYEISPIGEVVQS